MEEASIVFNVDSGEVREKGWGEGEGEGGTSEPGE